MIVQNLDVFLWDRKVGSLVGYKEEYVEKVYFCFDGDFVKGGYDIAPLRAPIKGLFAQCGLPVYAEGDKIFGTCRLSFPINYPVIEIIRIQ